jgi:ketosteroid isomerase-like protein
MKKSIIIFIILVVIIIHMSICVPLFAQEWSAEQNEVWKNVETYHEFWANRDVEGFLQYFHDDFSGWYNRDIMPRDKAAVVKRVKYYFPKTKVIFYEINPIAIEIHGNVAIVQYFYSDITKDPEGKEKGEQGGWTDILMKQEDKWVMIGDHGGPIEIE